MHQFPIPVYAKVLDHGKKRRVRLFGDVMLIEGLNVKTLRIAGYLFIKNEPRTRYTRERNDSQDKRRLRRKESQGKEAVKTYERKRR